MISLFRKYDFPIPIDDWRNKVEAPTSVLEACQQGVQGEIENREMYQRLLNLTQEYPDVQQVFLNLQRASQENHLPAFQRCARKGENTNNFCSKKGKSAHCGNRHRRGWCY